MPSRSRTANAGSALKSKTGDFSTKERAGKVFTCLKKKYPAAKPALNFNSSFELLIATILSAQCTDARVNLVTPVLFRKFPSPEKLAGADGKEVERIIEFDGVLPPKGKVDL